MAFVIAFAIAIAITPLAGRVGRALGLVDAGDADPLKIHRRPVPATGGLAVVVAFFVVARPPVAAVAGVVLALAVGIVDDIRPQAPALRLLLLGLAGSLIGFAADPGLASTGLGIGLVLLCSTSVNMIDGQDGLASGLAAISSVALALVAIRVGLTPTIALVLTGALLGFLPWNFPRARIFLGNAGAYAIGAALAYLATQIIVRDEWRGLIVAGACLAVFNLEFGVTLFRRLVSRSPLTGGDRFHSYDLLAERLRSRRTVTVSYWLFGAALAGSAVALSESSLGTALVGAAAGWGAGVIAAVFTAKASAKVVISDG